MSFIAKWINENLLRRNNKIAQEPPTTANNIEDSKIEINHQETVNQIIVNNTDDVNINDELVSKWYPKNDLSERYNKFINNVAELNRQKHSLETKLIPRSKQLIKEYMSLYRSTNINDKITCCEIKKEMISYERKIKIAEGSIKILETISSDVLEEWNTYLEDAYNFLNNNIISPEITINDILSDCSLYLMSKKFLDGYCTNINTDMHIEIIKDIKKYFDISSFKNTSSFSLKEYEDKKNKLLELEKKNSLIVVREAPHVFLRDINNIPIEYDLNINSNPIDITSEIMTDLDEEVRV
jgi:hypothetical protein